MRLRYSLWIAACFAFAACSPSAEEIKTILNAYIAGLGEEGSTLVTNVEQTEKNIYSGTYSVSKDTLTAYIYPFTAIIKKDQVTQFFKDTDETKVKVVNKQTGTEETKVEYDERIKKEEELRKQKEAELKRQEIARTRARTSTSSGSGSGSSSISFPMTINFPGSQWAYSQNNWNATFYFRADGSVHEDWGTYSEDSYWSDWSGGQNGKLIVVKAGSSFWCFSFSERKAYYGYSNFRSKKEGVPFRIIK